MFSGIVETTAAVVASQERAEVIQITLERPKSFKDLHPGDSVAVDGVCLTLEAHTPDTMTFALGPETLKVTGWTANNVNGRVVNLERSLRLGDRIHGHLVTGHVDATADVLSCEGVGETRTLSVRIPDAIRALIWPKGSIAINGVSLTINFVANKEGFFQVGLIPETLKRTGLGLLKVGSVVNLEADNFARGLVHWAELRRGAQT